MMSPNISMNTSAHAGKNHGHDGFHHKFCLDLVARQLVAIVARPSADFHVPYAAPMLPKTSASAAPRKPKNGAYVGQYGEIAIERERPPEEHRPRCDIW